jgi:signal peptidase I
VSGISTKDLIREKINGFSRKFKISGINSNQQFEAIRPYVLGLINSDINNFRVSTGYKGIPPKIIAENRLRVTEIKELEKTISITNEEYNILKNKNVFDTIYRIFKTKKSYNTSFFPNDIKYDWNEDNFGPIIIPRKDQEIELNKENLPLFKKIIRDYEKNKLELIDDKIFINGNETDSYKFKMDYFWMMGDNRYNSEDSRAWGYVPENHVVGRPIFIWMSIDGINDGIINWKIRWNRVFTTIHEDGEPRSYLIHFIVFCIICWIANKFFISKNKK